jgi:hypothetical protein
MVQAVAHVLMVLVDQIVSKVSIQIKQIVLSKPLLNVHSTLFGDYIIIYLGETEVGAVVAVIVW